MGAKDNPCSVFELYQLFVQFYSDIKFELRVIKFDRSDSEC